MAYSLDQLSSMMDNLAGRVAVLDGVGLTAPAQGQVPALTARVNGQDTKIRSLTANLQAQLKTLDNYRANMEGRLWAISAAVTIINIAMGIAWYALRKGP